MRYVAAYLLAVLGGNVSPKAKDVKKILGSVGIEAEDDKLDKVIKELSGKKISGLMAEGMSKLASMPAGGVAAAGGGGARAASGGGGGAAPAAEEKEETKEESEEESDDDMGFGLFD